MFGVRITKTAQDDLSKLDKFEAKRITTYLTKNIHVCENPRDLGKPLKDMKPNTWRYRVGKLRILCEIDVDEEIVLVHAVLSRDKAYL